MGRNEVIPLTSRPRKAFRNRLILSIFLIVSGLTAVAILANSVIGELRLLNSARSDNIQWSLSQTEVEFLEFERALLSARNSTPPDLKLLRREFDILYSRITTLGQSAIYAPVRNQQGFRQNLKNLQIFLTNSLSFIDGTDAKLTSGLSKLAKATEQVRPEVRKLSNSGLSYFANLADQRRKTISDTLIRLALIVSVLTITLLLLAGYLGRLNRLNIRRTKEALQANMRMNTVTRTALDAVIVADASGTILDFNAAAELTFGHSVQEAIGSNMSTLILPDHHLAAHETGIDQMRLNGENPIIGKGRVQMEAKRANGETFPVELAVQSAETNEGEIFVSFWRDISYRVAAEQDLVRARDRALAGEKAKTDFLATMSHEIRTPLNGLLGSLSLLEDTDLDTYQKGYIRNMNTSGKLLRNHISDVLDITRYDRGKLELHPIDLNVSALVQGVIDTQSATAAKKGITLSWSWKGPKIDWVRADQERIQHVVLNIIGNAVKFTDQGYVSVEVSRQGPPNAPVLQIKVKDSGIGIPPDLRDQVFDDFKTGDNSYDRNEEGTGLGLGIAKRFITAMGGGIDFESELGTGSTFNITFPVTQIDLPKLKEPIMKPQKPTPSQSVLLVEDNEINRMVAREMLRKEGHEVTEAKNGQIAVELAQAQHFDLILMDISMPIMDGRTATRAIRAGNGSSAHSAIVALTANAVPEEQAAFLSDGMNDVLTKPLSRKGLIALVSSIELASETRESTDQPAGEAPKLTELRETLGETAAKKTVSRFVKEVDASVKYLSGSSRPAPDDVAPMAHRLAGSAALMGAADLRAHLKEIENSARGNTHEKLTALCDDLPDVWRKVRVRYALA